MKELAIRLWQPRVRISSLLTISLMAMLFCFINLPIVFVGLIELAVLTGCVVLFRKFDVTQYELFQYKPHWFWRICEWYWTIYFCYWVLPFVDWLGFSHPILKYIYFVYPSIFKPLTDWAILCYGKEVAVQYLSRLVLTPIILLVMPICYYCFRWLFKQVAEFFQSLTRFEVGYLTISSAILITILLVVSAKTNFFVYPIDKIVDSYESKNLVISDVFFNMDTTHLLKYKFYEGSNYCRHPYYSYVYSFFLPLNYFIQLFLVVLYKSQFYAFTISLSIVQIILYSLSGILIQRLYVCVCQRTFSNIIAIVYLTSFPVIYIFCPERLILTSFTLILSIYVILNSRCEICSLISGILAIGTTSLSLLPVVLAFILKNKKAYIILVLLPLTFVTIIRGYNHINPNTESISKIQGINKVKCYSIFIDSCFFIPKWHSFEVPQRKIKQSNGTFWTYAPSLMIDTDISLISNMHVCTAFFIVTLCLIACGTYRLSYIVLLSMFWVIISLIIVGIIGFGLTASVLYVTYFSWAIIPLALLPFYWLWQKFPKLPIPQSLYAFAAYLAISNLYFLYQVVQIVSDRYIVPPGM